MDHSPVDSPPVQPGEEEVRELYLKHAAEMLRYALNLCQSRDAAEDAVQEAFLGFCIARSRQQQITNPRIWLFRTLRNELLDKMRPTAEVGLEDLRNSSESAYDPEAGYGRTEFVSVALKTVLTPRESECLLLRAEGMRYEEIAEVLGLRKGTIGALLARAHQKIRRLVASDRTGAALGVAFLEKEPHAP